MPEEMFDARAGTEALANYIAIAHTRPLPKDVLEKTKYHILDSFAAMISGAHLIPGKMALLFAQSQGGPPESMVVGSNLLVSAINAALANAMMAHADESDDAHDRGRFHPGCSVIPAALAVAERENSNGEDFLRAIALGYDVGVRVNLALGPTYLRDGGHSTHGVGAGFGAVAAASSLLRLNPEQARHALAYTVQQASGCTSLIRDSDHVEKAFDFGGMGSRNGVTAAIMAKLGFTGVNDPFDAPNGFLDTFSEEPNPTELDRELGSRYEIMDAQIKKWPVGNPNQTPIESLSHIMADHGLKSDQVTHISVTIPTFRFAVVNNSKMPNICMQHLLALLLIDGKLTFASSHDEMRMSDPAVLDLRKKIDLVASDEFSAAIPPRPALVEVLTTDGRTLSHHTRAIPGSPYAPLLREEIENKALDLISSVSNQNIAQQVIARVWSLENLESVQKLRPLLQR